MTEAEKAAILGLFCIPAKWCQGNEAANAAGDAVRYDDPTAVAWDLTGGICVLLGWERSLELFPQLEGHCIQQPRGPEKARSGIASMIELQNFNDDANTTYEMVFERLQTIPVPIGRSREALPSV